MVAPHAGGHALIEYRGIIGAVQVGCTTGYISRLIPFRRAGGHNKGHRDEYGTSHETTLSAADVAIRTRLFERRRELRRSTTRQRHNGSR